jgi:hypothetical protein
VEEQFGLPNSNLSSRQLRQPSRVRPLFRSRSLLWTTTPARGMPRSVPPRVGQLHRPPRGLAQSMTSMGTPPSTSGTPQWAGWGTTRQWPWMARRSGSRRSTSPRHSAGVPDQHTGVVFVHLQRHEDAICQPVDEGLEADAIVLRARRRARQGEVLYRARATVVDIDAASGGSWAMYAFDQTEKRKAGRRSRQWTGCRRDRGALHPRDGAVP